MTTPGGSDSGAPPTDYRLLLPEGWFRVHIGPELRERSVDALVSRQFEGVDNAPHLKRQLRESLLAQAAAAFRDGGIELYLSLQKAGALTIPASLLVTLLPLTGGDQPSAQDIAARLSVDEELEVTVVDLSSGPAVRTLRSTGQADRPAPAGVPGSPDETLPSVTVDYQLPIPGAGASLLLTFSTPLIQIAEAMVQLFDAVAASLVWVGGDGSHE
ncbi:hypothetical protein [Streptomyces sp. SID5643]|uniref:hypothetical protein n=1 Tax=Streptomyces sp. SID5643 TaxID=2690307 RepID=UPI001368FAC3|nr:hypothetical protein [Streptomyces sp. SID5643]MZF86804.1 hypothetical protein [Streptomyces sp. SID5643]